MFKFSADVAHSHVGQASEELALSAATLFPTSLPPAPTGHDVAKLLDNCTGDEEKDTKNTSSDDDLQVEVSIASLGSELK